MKHTFKEFFDTLTVFILGFYLPTVLLATTKALDDLCPGVLDKTNTICYVYRPDERTWQESELICQSLGGNLVSIQSSSESDFVRSVLQSQGVTNDVWLGGHLERFQQPATRLWRWISDCQHCGRDTNGNLAVSAQGCYKDQVNAHDLPYNISRLDGVLTPAACIEACRNGGFWFAGVQASNQCFCGNSFGLYGPIDSSVDQNNCVLGCSGDSSLRCGGTGLNFIYFVPGGYAEWGYAKPNNYKGYQTCVLLSQAIEFKFDDDDCGKTTAGFICDIPLTKCVNGSIQLNDSLCYYISTSESVTWFKARENCLGRGGDLLKLKDQGQLNLLRKSPYMKATKYWIGLVGLVWFWANGADLTYSNWYDVGGSEDWEPNEANNECIVISPEQNFQWMDSNCNLSHGFLCQITITPDTTTYRTKTQQLSTGSLLRSGTDPENVHVLVTEVMPRSHETETTSEHISTLKLSTLSTSNKFNEGEISTSSSDDGDNLQTLFIDRTPEPDSTDNDAGLTTVEKVLIAVCVVLVVVMLVILVMLLVHRNNTNRNKVGDDASNDVPGSSLNKPTPRSPVAYNNHKAETEQNVSKDEPRKTRIIVQ